jgi:hypothetical protein
MHPGDAVAAWHAALERGDCAPASQAWLDSQLARRGLYFGNRPLCTVLRPRFLSQAQYALLRSRGAVLLRAFDKAYEAARERPDVFEQFLLEAWESELFHADPASGPPNPLARLDAFFDAEGRSFRLTELNGETPAGAAYGDELARIFLSMPVAREMLRAWVLWPLPVRHRVMHTLLEAWERFSGRRELPALAIVDWREVPTRSEFLLFQEYFAEHGLACVIADPGELEYRGGRLTAAGTRVDLIYKRILLSELVARGGLAHPLIRAGRDGAVCLVNGFRGKLLHKKASLAVLSDERNAALFDTEERAAIADHVPWTRVVTERRTRYGPGEVDLVPFMLRERERLVLKPNDEYGGAGVVLGWETDAAAWERAVRVALDAPHIVQERIPLPALPFPALVNGVLRYADRLVDTAPFAFGGTVVDGCLTRISPDALVNVTAGGGSTVSTFVVEHRG